MDVDTVELGRSIQAERKVWFEIIPMAAGRTFGHSSDVAKGSFLQQVSYIQLCDQEHERQHRMRSAPV
jgi:hypothetical protein